MEILSRFFLGRFDIFERFFFILLVGSSSSVVEIGALWFFWRSRARFFYQLCCAVWDVDGRGSCGVGSGCFVYVVVFARLAITDSNALILASSVCLESSEFESEIMCDSLSETLVRSFWQYLWGLLVARFGSSVSVALVFWRLTPLDLCWPFGMMEGWCDVAFFGDRTDGMPLGMMMWRLMTWHDLKNKPGVNLYHLNEKMGHMIRHEQVLWGDPEALANVHYDNFRAYVYHWRFSLPKVGHQVYTLCGCVQATHPVCQFRFFSGDFGDVWTRFRDVPAVWLVRFGSCQVVLALLTK